MNKKMTSAPELSPEAAAQALWDSTGMMGRNGEAQQKACRIFGSRVADFLARLPADAKIGDVVSVLRG